MILLLVAWSILIEIYPYYEGLYLHCLKGSIFMLIEALAEISASITLVHVD